MLHVHITKFTDPKDPKKKRKDKWLFTKKNDPLFCIAGIWRTTPEVGEAFTMLTMEPGPDIAPYHDRQIVVLDRADWADWLDPTVPAKSLIKPLAAGTLTVEQVGWAKSDPANLDHGCGTARTTWRAGLSCRSP